MRLVLKMLLIMRVWRMAALQPYDIADKREDFAMLANSIKIKRPVDIV